MASRRGGSPRNISFAIFMSQPVSRCHKTLSRSYICEHMAGFVEFLKVKRYETAP